MEFYARLSGVPAGERDRQIAALLERVELARFRNVPLRKFSKGMLQRAGIAQALLGDPRLIVLDEPMSGLDPLGRVLVRDIILEERAAGRTVFFSSHILSDVEQLSDRVAIVVGGELREEGTVAELVGNAVASVDVTFSGSADLPGVAVLREADGRRTVRVAAEEVDTLCRAVLDAGGSIVTVQRNVRSLENVLLDEVERARLVNEKNMGVLA
jgi:ABC-2 type transport system ATP-binding protein